MEDLKELIEKVKGLMENPPSEEVIAMYLEDALAYCTSYTNQERTYVITYLSNCLTGLAISMLNTRGAEGLASQSYSGISESYATEISPVILKQLKVHRRLRK